MQKAQTPSYESFNEFWATGLSTIKELNEVSAHAWREISEQQVGFMKLCADTCNKEWQIWMSGKDPLEIMAAQPHLFSDFSAKCMESTRDGISKMSEAMEETMTSLERFKPFWGSWTSVMSRASSGASEGGAASWEESPPSKTKKAASQS